jgi:hypothetical protein
MRAWIGSLLVLSLVACAGPPPFTCTTALDGSGRGIPVCRAENQVPVCDAPGVMARFTGPSVSTLADGSLAVCDSSNQVVCSDRTVLPHCLLVPPPE